MTPPNDSSRRDFLQASAGATLAASLAFPGGAHAAANDVLKIGLIGCGGRGTGAAINAMTADPNVKLVAMADAFEDKLQLSLASMAKAKIAKQVDVPPDARFVGFDAYRKVIERTDVVLLCTPPHFRPLHLKAAIEAGKHVFAEKPCAVDAPGVRSILESTKKAKEKNLSIVAGLCLRYNDGFRDVIRRVHDGEVGDVFCLQANDYRGSIRKNERKPDWSEMTWQMRNWYYYTWLSGDFNVEQHVHYLDVCAWAMKEQYPVRAVGMGGRQVRTEPECGHIFDHFSIVYEFANGARFFSNCRQQEKCSGDMSASIIGTKGQAHLSDRRKGEVWMRFGDKQWFYEGPERSMMETEHAELYNSVRNGKPINNGEYLAKSTLLAIMGRMAAYTGQTITWEQALNSKEDLSPAKYDWDVELPKWQVAMPGRTKFV
jgi:predicted dehydrogenase